MLSGKEIVSKALELKDWNYLYGAKHSDNPITLNKINQLRKQNSQIYTDSYYNKALKFIGKNAIDCSGLNCYAYDIPDIGSWQIAGLGWAESKITNDIPIGSTLWKPGHCGIYKGDGEVIEARGIDYGVVISKVSERDFQKAFIPDFPAYENLGWCYDDGKGWWLTYGLLKGQYYANQVVYYNGQHYVFDEEGYCIKNATVITTDRGAVIKYVGERVIGRES